MFQLLLLFRCTSHLGLSAVIFDLDTFAFTEPGRRFSVDGLCLQTGYKNVMHFTETKWGRMVSEFLICKLN